MSVKQVAVTLACIALFMIFGSVAFFMDSIVYPLWVALGAHVQVLLKALTPQNFFLFIKNGTLGVAKKKAISVGPEIVVQGYSPWRRKTARVRQAIADKALTVVALYRGSPLWVQIAIAAGILILGASSGYAILAVLIIPQPVMIFLKTQITALLNKTGVTKLFTWITERVIPQKWRFKYRVLTRWKIGRRKILLARKIHKRRKKLDKQREIT